MGPGIQRILDAQLGFVRNSLPVWVRTRNFVVPPNTTLAGQLGFAISPTGSNVGTTDTLMQPPPAVRMVSMHNIGMSGGKLRMGARIFIFTPTSVQSVMGLVGVTDILSLVTSKQFVGLVTDGKLFSVEDIAHEEIAGVTVEVSLTANGTDLK